jgi:sugar lactone lactonase YvrE
MTHERSSRPILLPCLFAILAIGGASTGARAQAAPPAGDSVRTVAPELAGSVGGVAVDKLGLIYVADFGEQVFKITPDGRVSVFATGLYGASGNAIDSQGRLLQSSFLGDWVSRIARDGTQTVVARGLAGPVGIAVNSDDSFVVCNCRGNSLSLVASSGAVTRFAASPLLNCPNGITRQPDGTYYVVNYSDARVLKVSPKGQVSEFAVLPGGGNGHITSAGGDLYATSFQGHRVYRISLAGEVTLVAGTGSVGEQDGTAADATFSWPNGIAAGPTGDRLYVNDFVNRFPPTIAAPPAPRSSLRQITFAPLSARLADALASGGVEAMTTLYHDWKANSARARTFTELEVNAFGYRLLGADRLEEAIAVFRLNVESYASSANVHDSLGEAYMKAGRKAEAIASYEQSLKLNPGNDNAVKMLKILRGGVAPAHILPA